MVKFSIYQGVNDPEDFRLLRYEEDEEDDLPGRVVMNDGSEEWVNVHKNLEEELDAAIILHWRFNHTFVTSYGECVIESREVYIDEDGDPIVEAKTIFIN